MPLDGEHNPAQPIEKVEISVLLTPTLLRKVEGARGRDAQGRRESLSGVVGRLLRVGLHHLPKSPKRSLRGAQEYIATRANPPHPPLRLHFLCTAPGIVTRAHKRLMRMGVCPGMSLATVGVLLKRAGWRVILFQPEEGTPEPPKENDG